jgi:hypothetical protein
MTVRELVVKLRMCDPDAKVIASVRDSEEVLKVQAIDIDSSLSIDGEPTVMIS